MLRSNASFRVTEPIDLILLLHKFSLKCDANAAKLSHNKTRKLI